MVAVPLDYKRPFMNRVLGSKESETLFGGERKRTPHRPATLPLTSIIHTQLNLMQSVHHPMGAQQQTKWLFWLLALLKPSR